MGATIFSHLHHAVGLDRPSVASSKDSWRVMVNFLLTIPVKDPMLAAKLKK
jgi:hypothetical protein